MVKVLQALAGRSGKQLWLADESNSSCVRLECSRCISSSVVIVRVCFRFRLLLPLCEVVVNSSPGVFPF